MSSAYLLSLRVFVRKYFYLTIFVLAVVSIGAASYHTFRVHGQAGSKMSRPAHSTSLGHDCPECSAKSNESVASQKQDVRTNLGSDTPEVEKIIKKLRDKKVRVSSPKEIVEAITKAKIIIGANTFSGKDKLDQSPKLYSPELLSALIDLLDWQQPKRTDDFDPAHGMPVFPAISAISVMNQSALPSLIEVLENEPPESRKFKNALQVIQNIFRHNDVETVNYLRVKASVSKTDVGGRNLLLAADLVLKEQKELEQRLLFEKNQ